MRGFLAFVLIVLLICLCVFAWDEVHRLLLVSTIWLTLIPDYIYMGIHCLMSQSSSLPPASVDNISWALTIATVIVLCALVVMLLLRMIFGRRHYN